MLFNYLLFDVGSRNEEVEKFKVDMIDLLI